MMGVRAMCVVMRRALLVRWPQDPARARGGPGGVLAGAAATFTLSLLELHLRAPGGRIAPGSGLVAALAKACLRPFRTGLLPGARVVAADEGARWQGYNASTANLQQGTDTTVSSSSALQALLMRCQTARCAAC